MTEPTVCDNCGRSLDRGNEHFIAEWQTQALPPGETLNGRGYIVVCAHGECLRNDKS